MDKDCQQITSGLGLAVIYQKDIARNNKIVESKEENVQEYFLKENSFGFLNNAKSTGKKGLRSEESNKFIESNLNNSSEKVIREFHGVEIQNLCMAGGVSTILGGQNHFNVKKEYGMKSYEKYDEDLPTFFKNNYEIKAKGPNSENSNKENAFSVRLAQHQAQQNFQKKNNYTNSVSGENCEKKDNLNPIEFFFTSLETKKKNAIHKTSRDLFDEANSESGDLVGNYKDFDRNSSATGIATSNQTSKSRSLNSKENLKIENKENLSALLEKNIKANAVKKQQNPFPKTFKNDNKV